MNDFDEKNRSDHKFGASTEQIALKLLIVSLLLLAAALVFFSCRETNGAKKSEAHPTHSPSPAPSSVFTDGRRNERFAEDTYVLGINIGGMTRETAENELKERVDAELDLYECKLNYGNKSFTFTSEDMNLESDIDEVLSNALRLGRGEYKICVHPVDGPKLKSSIEAVAESVDSPVRDAELIGVEAAGDSVGAELERNSRFVVTAPIDGAKLDPAETAKLILGGAREAELPVDSIKASAVVPSLPQRRAIFSTSYNSPSLSAPGRVHNIQKAASLINARALAPGETLSCNDVLGERTKENGWQTGTAFASGGRETEQQYGGGICQVSTTLYNCALMAGLEIPKRIGHSRKVAYIEGGRDASLSWGSADLVVKNSTDETIHIFMWTDENKNCLNCEIYGGSFPDEYDEIRIISELIEVIEPGEPEFTTDDSLEDGECVTVRSARRGRTYQTYLEYLKNGEPLRLEPVARTAYPVIPALYAVPKPKE